MCHDVTTPPAISMLVEKGIDRVFDPDKIVVTPDHFQPAKDVQSAELHKRLDEWARRHSIKHYYKLGRAGVCHALLPEQGHIRPGEVIVGGDSHTCTYGAFAAFSTGIGSTDLAAAIATGKLWFKVPASMKFVLNGSLPQGVYSKDVILAVIGRIGTDGRLYRAMEFVGPALAGMSHGSPHDDDEYGHRGRGQERHHPVRRHDQGVSPGASEGERRVYRVRVRRGRRVSRDGSVRLLEAGADGGFAASAQQRGPDRPVRGQGDGPGLHRQLHQRPDRGPPHRGEDHEGQAGGDPHD